MYLAPNVVALAVICLGLGIGVSTAIFGLINCVYLRPLPVSRAGDVVILSRGGQPMFSWPEHVKAVGTPLALARWFQSR
jgi:hypothetical protein